MFKSQKSLASWAGSDMVNSKQSGIVAQFNREDQDARVKKED